MQPNVVYKHSMMKAFQFIRLADGSEVHPNAIVAAYVIDQFGRVLQVVRGDREIIIEPARGIGWQHIGGSSVTFSAAPVTLDEGDCTSDHK
jgi:hypothetical protein